MFVLVHSTQDKNSKRYKVIRYYLRRAFIKNYNVIINGTNFFDQPIDSESYYKSIVVDLSRQKELDVDLKAIQQIEFVEQLKKCDDVMFVLTI